MRAIVRNTARSMALCRIAAAFACADAHDDVIEVVTSMAGALSEVRRPGGTRTATCRSSCRLSAKTCRTTIRSKTM